MTPLLALLLGFAIPALGAGIALRLLEGRSAVLTVLERFLLSLTLGPTLGMFVVFLVHSLTQAPLHARLFLEVLLGIDLALLIVYIMRRRTFLPPLVAAAPRVQIPRAALVLLVTLSLWTLIKIAVAGTTFLLLVPTYASDALDNWNLRGKVFYEDQALTLILPGQTAEAAKSGVSSYPPTVPLFKTYLATLHGDWHEALVNAPHAVWFLLLLSLLFALLLRLTGWPFALLGIVILVGLPLELMHGTTNYADVFVSLHLLAAVGLLLLTMRSDKHQRAGLLRVAGLSAAALAWTKNESVLLYLPIFAALWMLCLYFFHVPSRRIPLRASAGALLLVTCVLLPWLIFKWSHGLTFGNAKPLSSLAFAWQPGVLSAIAINLFFEGNWLMLPVFFPILLLMCHRKVLSGTLIIPTGFVLAVSAGHMVLYLFTPLSAEALMQTGFGRGLIHIAPIVVLVTTALLPGFLREARRD